MLRMLIVALVLFGRLIGPVSAAGLFAPPEGQDPAFLAGAICHSGDGPAAPAPEPGKTSGHVQDCQLCPACHMPTLAVLPDSSPSVVWMTWTRPADRPAAPPPSTGPPHAMRLAARPTGPPSSIA